MEKRLIWETSKKGYLTLKEKNQYLHSPYQPINEAKRFIEKEKLEKDSIIIMPEPLLGYIIPLVQEMVIHPIIIISMDDECHNFRSENFHNILQYKMDGFVSENILFQWVDELNFDKVKLLNWPASIKLFSDQYEIVFNIIKDHLARCQMNRMNTQYLGYRKFRNTLKNSRFYRNFYEIPEDQPGNVLLVAPGPSLESISENIKEHQSAYYIAALASSLPYLQEHNITPDLIFTQDAGYWASLHYSYISNYQSCPVIMPLSACSAIKDKIKIIVPFNDGNFLSSALFPEISSHLPEVGTVSATALLWLCKHFTGSIKVAGLDLGSRGIKSHIRPYSIDNFLETSTGRTNSMLQIQYQRFILQNSRGEKHNPLSIYKEWFQQYLNTQTKEISSLTPTSLDIPHKISTVQEKKNFIININPILINESPKERMNIVLQNVHSFLEKVSQENWSLKNSTAEFLYQYFYDWVMGFLDGSITRNQLFQYIMKKLKADCNELLE